MSLNYRVWILLRQGVLDTTLCDKVCQWLVTGGWFSSGTLVSSTNKTDHHDITKIFLKVAINTISLTSQLYAGKDHTCQVTRFRRVTPGNRACHPHFPEHPSGHGFHYDDPESPGIGPDIRNIYLFGKYRDFTYRKDNNPNGQLQSTTIYLRGK